MRHVMNAVDLAREARELLARQPEVHRGGVALDEVHAGALLERERFEGGHRLARELGANDRVDEGPPGRVSVGAEELFAHAAGRKRGEARQ